jgi:hypothetical protein
MRRYQLLGGLMLGTALMAPVALQAQDETKKTTTTTTTTTETKRIYDPVEKDYHVWNDQEDRAYRVYLQENRRDYVEFPKVKTTEQTEYWKWRHGHPNSVIFKSERTEERNK